MYASWDKRISMSALHNEDKIILSVNALLTWLKATVPEWKFLLTNSSGDIDINGEFVGGVL